jgi:ABC-type transport system involved in cytochrome bd biosynthesis fused ATPase/permease subunit
VGTIAHADKIAVLEDGRLTELGTHEELMAAGGAYRDMVVLQTEGSRVPARPRHEEVRHALAAHGEE